MILISSPFIYPSESKSYLLYKIYLYGNINLHVECETHFSVHIAHKDFHEILDEALLCDTVVCSVFKHNKQSVINNTR